jgi:hypothetical protein
MKTCETCKHWENGPCLAITYNYLENGYEKEQSDFSINISVGDDQGLDVEFITSKDFGCIKHEEK